MASSSGFGDLGLLAFCFHARFDYRKVVMIPSIHFSCDIAEL
jgi:hypothetical protein